MNCQELVARVERLQPDASPTEIARLALLLMTANEEADDAVPLSDDDSLLAAVQEISIKLKAAIDQHAAMASELEELAASDPEKFQPEQVWVLVRAIKVQSQNLQLYMGQLALDV